MKNLKDYEPITFAIFSYNQEKYIREAVEAALQQTYPLLEIIISDDHSNDETFHIIQEIVSTYNGQHKIILNRNIRNLGICNHVNKVLGMASSDIIVMSAGDDVSLPERTERISQIFSRSNNCTKAVFSNALKIDNHGNEFGLQFPVLPRFNKNISDFKRQQNCWVLGATFAFKKEIFTKYGEISKSNQEDGMLAFRALLIGDLDYVDEPLVKYRRHDNNVSDPNDAEKRLNFQRSRYLLHTSWLKDAQAFNYTDQYLISRLKQILFCSKSLNLLLSIPLIGLFFNQAVVKIRRLLKK